MENDLVGTWQASYSPDDKDTLIIKGDGTYKQIYENQDVILVETEWQKWRLEWRKSDYARLHLEEMRMCDDIESICNREGAWIPKNTPRLNGIGRFHWLKNSHDLISAFSAGRG